MKLVLASSNQGKLAELRYILEPLGWQLTPQSEFNVSDADETGLSFIENAILKARHAAKLAGLPALADDSGLEVDALNGAPGIYSSRYAGEHGDDAANNAKLLSALAGIPDEQRTARFRCVIAVVKHAADPAPMIAQGVWEGRILHEVRGQQGFGYDPLFWLDAVNKSSAELNKEEKNRISHRAKALAELSKQINPPLAS